MNYTLLSLDTWKRKVHFEFFKDFEEPFFGVCVPIDVTDAYLTSKQDGIPFFIRYLYAVVKAANMCEPFRYRLDADQQVRIYDVVNISSTINRDNGTFGFSYISYHDDFQVFVKEATLEIQTARDSNELIPSNGYDNTLHFSTLPWLKFTSLSHARKLGINDSVPKMTFGKLYKEEERWFMPFSVHVHHALMDGSHVGNYVACLQELLTPNIELGTNEV